MTMYEKKWTAEQHLEDLQKKIVALDKMTAHHEEEALVCRVRANRVANTKLMMLQDLSDALYWDINDLEQALDSRAEGFHITDQKRRNEMFSEIVDLKLQKLKYDKEIRELKERLKPS